MEGMEERSRQAVGVTAQRSQPKHHRPLTDRVESLKTERTDSWVPLVSLRLLVGRLWGQRDLDFTLSEDSGSILLYSQTLATITACCHSPVPVCVSALRATSPQVPDVSDHVKGLRPGHQRRMTGGGSPHRPAVERFTR
ncbi:hypothetical protein F2P81_000907 [Scophthalmus maximus]|uniref:Uncharacterized protein n=1 Tax=Scophthalmus maximus TaxID=52904 RepID=A0A6A4TVU8_SCOMX|nr:hypothetical protein F2P81_000907 [Scophthalmus maximus]